MHFRKLISCTDLASVVSRVSTFFKLSLVLLSSGHALAQAQNSYSEPVLRIEIGQHTAPITGIAVDENEQILVTGSADKTARVWDLESGRLLAVLRVPIGLGNLGQIGGVAVSPDGSSIAVSAAPESIYIFDRQSARIRLRIAGLPNLAKHLAFSPDGRYLAAPFYGQTGIRIYRTSDYKEIARDEAYGDHSYWADFDLQNRLITASYDGYIRLYDSSLSLRKKAIPATGAKPFSVAFSPDGSKIAVGYFDSTRVDVLSADDLTILYTANQPGGKKDFLHVAWSQDGEYLFAAGGSENAKGRFVRRWARGGRGRETDINVSENTVFGLVPLQSGRIAVGAADPLCGVFDAQGKPIWVHTRQLPDFRGQRGSNSIRLSLDARVVEFGYRLWGEDRVAFSLSDMRLTRGRLSAPNMLGAAIGAPNLKLTDWSDNFYPKLNNELLPLWKYERSRSLAISPDRRHFLLGTEYNLRYFDEQGHEIWRVRTPGTAWAVNVALNGRVAVAGLGDGSLRWYRLTDGEELLALVVDSLSDRWVVSTPQGYYNSRVGFGHLLGWHVNRGPDETPEFANLSRYREQLYRPDVIDRILDTLDVSEALDLANQARD